jgi:hypothetical protein
MKQSGKNSKPKPDNKYDKSDKSTKSDKYDKSKSDKSKSDKSKSDKSDKSNSDKPNKPEKTQKILTNRDKYTISAENKNNLHKIWLDNKVEVGGRLTDKPYIDVIGYETGIPSNKIRYDLPGIRFHTHPKIQNPLHISETLTPPSAEDYINIIQYKQTEYVLTEHGIWMIQPLRTNTFMSECALTYYISILNIQLTHDDSAIFPNLKKSRDDIAYLAKTYASLVSDPDGRILNISNKKTLKYITDETVEIISQMYSAASPTDIVKGIHVGMAQFIGDPPIKLTWHPY